MISAARELSLNVMSIMTGTRHLQVIERRVNKGLRRYMGAEDNYTQAIQRLRPMHRRIDLSRKAVQG